MLFGNLLIHNGFHIFKSIQYEKRDNGKATSPQTPTPTRKTLKILRYFLFVRFEKRCFIKFARRARLALTFTFNLRQTPQLL